VIGRHVPGSERQTKARKKAEEKKKSEGPHAADHWRLLAGQFARPITGFGKIISSGTLRMANNNFSGRRIQQGIECGLLSAHFCLHGHREAA